MLQGRSNRIIIALARTYADRSDCCPGFWVEMVRPNALVYAFFAQPARADRAPTQEEGSRIEQTLRDLSGGRSIPAKQSIAPTARSNE
jgi:hypothetical protein